VREESYFSLGFLLKGRGRMVTLIRERERERKSLLERGLSFASQEDINRNNLTGFEDDEEDDEGDRAHEEGGELFALLRELAGLQVRLASLMEKMGSLPLDLIRDMRQEVVEVTDQLRNINRSHRR